MKENQRSEFGNHRMSHQEAPTKSVPIRNIPTKGRPEKKRRDGSA